MELQAGGCDHAAKPVVRHVARKSPLGRRPAMKTRFAKAAGLVLSCFLQIATAGPANAAAGAAISPGDACRLEGDRITMASPRANIRAVAAALAKLRGLEKSQLETSEEYAARLAALKEKSAGPFQLGDLICIVAPTGVEDRTRSFRYDADKAKLHFDFMAEPFYQPPVKYPNRSYRILMAQETQ